MAGNIFPCILLLFAIKKSCISSEKSSIRSVRNGQSNSSIARCVQKSVMALEKQMNYGFILGPQNVGEYKTMDGMSLHTATSSQKFWIL